MSDHQAEKRSPAVDPRTLRSSPALLRLVLILVCLVGGAAILRRGIVWSPMGPPPWTAFALFAVALGLLLSQVRPRWGSPSKRGGRDPSLVSELGASGLAGILAMLRPEARPADTRDDLEQDSVSAVEIVTTEPAEGVAPGEDLSILSLLRSLLPSGSQLRLPLALVLALIAQAGLASKTGVVGLQVLLYIVAGALFAWAVWVGDIGRPTSSKQDARAEDIPVRIPFLLASMVFSLLTLLTAGGNRFRPTTVIFWAAAMATILLAMWEKEFEVRPAWQRLKRWMAQPSLRLHLDGWSLLLLLATSLVAFFRFSQFGAIPAEMWSDHAEKLLDVSDVLGGRYSIFFPRNTGREALQFYLAAGTAKLFGTGVSFLTLKIGTTLAGMVILIYMYRLAREFAGRHVALAAFLLAGVGFWPNILSRIGLRFPFFPLFAAPAIFHLVRGLRRRRSNDLLLSGLFAGLGLHGYSPARVVPLVIVLGVLLFVLDRRSAGERTAVLGWLVAAGVVMMVAFLPLMRAAAEMPDLFMYRTLTRMTSMERAFPGSPPLIFLSNVWKGLGMFSWDNGQIWVVTVTGRPVFDFVTASLFHLGAVLLVVRYAKQRRWVDLFFLTSILVLMLPSTLALAFPNENPAPNRASGVMVPVFIIAALPLAAIPGWARNHLDIRNSRLWGVLIALALFVGASVSNYDLVFKQYAQRMRLALLNTSEAGRLVRSFADAVGDFDTAHVISYPHWFDTRLVGVVAGQPTTDYGIMPDQLESFVPEKRPQLFILNMQDGESLSRLQELFQSGWLSRWSADVPGKDFLYYFVPADRGASSDSGF